MTIHLIWIVKSYKNVLNVLITTILQGNKKELQMLVGIKNRFKMLEELSATSLQKWTGDVSVGTLLQTIHTDPYAKKLHLVLTSSLTCFLSFPFSSIISLFSFFSPCPSNYSSDLQVPPMAMLLSNPNPNAFT